MNNTMTEQIEQAIQRKIASYKVWRQMGVCHADAVDSILQGSCWGPRLKQEVRARCEALQAA
jgi:hypothetical protein